MRTQKNRLRGGVRLYVRATKPVCAIERNEHMLAGMVYGVNGVEALHEKSARWALWGVGFPDALGGPVVGTGESFDSPARLAHNWWEGRLTLK